MFRTRDFILLFTAITFLVSAIGVTVFMQETAGGAVADSNEVLQQQLAAGSAADYQAAISTPEGLNRAERVAQMRDKIAQAAELRAPVETESEEELPTTELATTTQEEQLAAAELDQCPSYAPYTGFWDARNLSLVDSEGAILVVRSELSPAGSSTQTTLVQLPKRLLPAPDQSCIQSDVIGIANDGSLIRNDEVGLYSVFSSDVQIGYALDGFPIYGAGSNAGDQCGGQVRNGQYRYELQPDEAVIINCFAAAPIMLP